MGQGRKAAGGLDSFASNSSLDSLEFTQLSGDSELGVSHMEPNIKKFVKECLNINWCSSAVTFHRCLQDTYVTYAAVLTEWKNDRDSANHVTS